MKIIRDKEADTDVTEDFLLCNRCGSCMSACPVYDVIGEEWSGPRGKVELAEFFFRGGKVDEKEINRVSEVCLHCKTCLENCPSGTRADEIIMAVKNEMGKRGLIPFYKRVLLFVLDGMNNFIFKTMRFFKLTRKDNRPQTKRSPFSFLFPLLGWPRQRFVPMPNDRSFIRANSGFFSAADAEITFFDPRLLTEKEMLGFDWEKAEELAGKVKKAREINLKNSSKACFFVGDMVNNFFSEEAQSIVYLLNLLGVDVVVPENQTCCFAPAFYSGDIAGARKGARRLIRILSSYQYDWLVTSCASGGLMLKKEYPRLLDLNKDGFFDIQWDSERELLKRKTINKENLSEEARLYSENIKGKIRDINELVAELLFFAPQKNDYEKLFSGHGAKEKGPDKNKKDIDYRCDGKDRRPVVVYHHPCHLNRGQGIYSEPEYILKMLPGYRYVRMGNDTTCCGGGGVFTFTESKISEKIARGKVLSITKAGADIVSTSCPVCRIQLMDMTGRDLGIEYGGKTHKVKKVSVKTPVELLVRDLKSISRP
ncbi:MAG: (Fe-S)-binding protein [Candidatus Krumholzibacteriota bacterium]|nr:(Fe-S)-binding protein [Candidatus Krumholzibacteriota bacterium]